MSGNVCLCKTRSKVCGAGGREGVCRYRIVGNVQGVVVRQLRCVNLTDACLVTVQAHHAQQEAMLMHHNVSCR